MTAAIPGRVTRFDQPAEPALRTGAVYDVPEPGRVEILLGTGDTGGVFDLIEVLIPPGGRWTAHRHAFSEWFRVLDGELEVLAPRRGQLRPLARVAPGQTCTMPPWAPHALRNTAGSPTRFLVTGQPGVMSRYFAACASDPVTPPGRQALAALAARYDIELITQTSQLPAWPGVRAGE